MSGEADNSYPRLEIGGTLWRVREKRGLSLQQVEEATKIQSRHLRDLENENFEALPTGRVRDYLEIYAEYLGLDGAVLMAEFRHRQAFAQAVRESASETPRAGQPRRLVAPLAHPFGEDDTVEDEVVDLTRRNSRLYVGFAAVLAFLVLATTLAWSLEGEGWAFISQMRGTSDPQVSSTGVRFGNAGHADANAKGETGEDQSRIPAADASMGGGGTTEQSG